MRKLLPLALAMLIAMGLVGCQSARTYQCEGAATDIRQAKEPGRAVENMEEYIAGDGKDQPCAYVMLFWGYGELGNFPQAIINRDKALELDPKSSAEIEDIIVENRFFIKARDAAITAIQGEDFELALGNSLVAQELEPEHYIAYYLAGECFRILDDMENAADQYSLAIAKLHDLESVGRFTMPDEGQAKRVYYRGCATLSDAEQYDKAWEAIELALDKFPEFTEVEMVRARLLVKEERNDEAEEAYLALIPKVEAVYNEAADEAAKETARHQYANLLSDVGVYYIQRNDLAAEDLLLAVGYLQQAYELDSESESVIRNLYLVYNQLGFTAGDDPKIAAVYDAYKRISGSY
ncbi:hypothetical protein K8R78_01130 [bacterium]|nr:hypothetical protein [bacterium]